MPTHRRTFDLVISFLGVTLILCVAGTIGLAVVGRDVPDLIGQVVIASLTAMGSLLARTPSEDTVPVRIQKDAGKKP